MSKKSSKSAACLFVSVSLSGCGTSEESIVGLGMMVLIAFIVLWISSVTFPMVQKSRPVQDLVGRCRKPIGAVSSLVMIVCTVMAVVSFYSSQGGVEILFVGVYTLGIIGSWYLKKWAKQIEAPSHPVELKMVVTVLTFIGALLWLIFCGVDMLKL